MEDVSEASGNKYNSSYCPDFVDPRDGSECCGRCKQARSNHTEASKQYDPEKNEQDDIKKREQDDSKKQTEDGVEEHRQDDSKKQKEDGVEKHKQDDSKKQKEDGVEKHKQDDNEQDHSKKCEQDNSLINQPNTGSGGPSTCKLPGCDKHRYIYMAGDFCGTKHANIYKELYGDGKSMASGSTGAITFYDQGSSYYEFTNFYRALIELDGKSWPTSEHYFQAQKFVGTPYMEMIRNLSTPREAFQMARDPSLSKWKRNDWEDVKDDVMLTALTCKFTQHQKLKKKLLKTRGKWLVEHTGNDSYWADGGDGSGQNKLGKFLMQVRSELDN